MEVGVIESLLLIYHDETVTVVYANTVSQKSSIGVYSMLESYYAYYATCDIQPTAYIALCISTQHTHREGERVLLSIHHVWSGDFNSIAPCTDCTQNTCTEYCVHQITLCFAASACIYYMCIHITTHAFTLCIDGSIGVMVTDLRKHQSRETLTQYYAPTWFVSMYWPSTIPPYLSTG